MVQENKRQKKLYSDGLKFDLVLLLLLSLLLLSL